MSYVKQPCALDHNRKVIQVIFMHKNFCIKIYLQKLVRFISSNECVHPCTSTKSIEYLVSSLSGENPAIIEVINYRGNY